MKKPFLINCITLLLLLLSKKSYAADMEDYTLGNAIFRLIFYIIIIVFVIIVAVFGTRFLAKSGKRFISSKYIKIIDSLSIGVNLRIIVIQVQNHIYILAITNSNIEVIDKIPKEEFKNEANFEEHLSLYKSNYLKNNKFFNRIQWDIKKVLDISSKVIDEEEGSNEKND